MCAAFVRLHRELDAISKQRIVASCCQLLRPFLFTVCGNGRNGIIAKCRAVTWTSGTSIYA